MHSRRMRTARLLPVSPSMHCAGGLSAPGEWCLLPGKVSDLGGVSALGGVCSQGGLCSRGVSALEGVCSWWGVCSRRSVCPSMQ